MERVTLSAPTMYADHHVLKVREILLALQGIEDVIASSAWQTVIVSYDPAKIETSAIEEALSKAGYGSDQATPVLAVEGEQFKDPAWEALGVRITQTNSTDRDKYG